MKRIITLFIILQACLQVWSQDRTVENRPYTDLRPFHFGVLVGAHLQDIEFVNAGPITTYDDNGNPVNSNVTIDQDRWDPGFTVGVLAELRLSTHFQLRMAPSMYFGTRHITFHPLAITSQGQEQTVLEDRVQELKTAYIGCAFDLIFAAPRFNNHRPYIMAGINPMYNLSGNNDDYVKLKKSDLFLELGLGCDFYLPFFKLRPELKFMYGISNVYDKSHANSIKDKTMLPYTMAATEAHSKMIALTFYFE